MTIIGWVLAVGGLSVLSIAVIAYIYGDCKQITDQEHIDWERWE